jgi:hypothetical protein
MDPYLEDPGLWPDVHHELISAARELLNAAVRPKYVVRIEQRVYVSDEDDPGREVIVPDIKITRRAGKRPGRAGSPAELSQIDVAEPLELITLLQDEIREPRLQIVDRRDRKLVTVVEIVSPTNKVAGSRGRADYLEKRQETMNSPVHWVEIDLLRTGVPVIPRSMVPLGDYFVHVSRAERRPRGQVWPIVLPQRLPAFKVPLKGKDENAILNLQRVLDTAYDRAGYDLDIDYRKGPVARLPKKYAAWARRLLRGKGLR